MTERRLRDTRLGGGPAHERLLLANLAAALFTHKSIQTTETKARRLRPLAERLITFAKRGDPHARRRVLSVIGDKEVVHLLFTEIAPLVADREHGYTRITKIGNRKSDNAPMAVIELVLEPIPPKVKSIKTPVAAMSPIPDPTDLGGATDADARQVGDAANDARYTRSSRAICEITASNRAQLDVIAQAINLHLSGFGREEEWVLASGLLRDLHEDPALLQITRSDDPHKFLLRVAWVGDEPDTSEIAPQLSAALHNVDGSDYELSGLSLRPVPYD